MWPRRNDSYGWWGVFLFLAIVRLLQGEGTPPMPQPGHMLFLMQQGAHQQAFKLYQNASQIRGQHDFELLHQMALRLLDEGFKQSDPECQLLALFGATISAHEEAYYILEESLQSPFPQIQLVALQALARIQSDRADQALLRTLGSPILIIRCEAVHQLCKKKHPQAIAQAESLMYKTPRALIPLYPSLFASIDDPQATKILRKLLTHSNEAVRLVTILSIGKYKRDDLLPHIRLQVTHASFAQQEACAYALGDLKDEQSIVKLQQLTLSQFPTVVLAAQLALYRLGCQEVIPLIEQAAKKEDLFAISALGSISGRPKVLVELLQSKSLQTRCNALLALLEQNDIEVIPIDLVKDILIRDERDLAFKAHYSPGHTFKIWRITTSAHEIFKDDLEAYQDHLELKESVLSKVCELSESHFLDLANQIFKGQQTDLIPYTVSLLEELGTSAAIDCLKCHHQQIGAPLVRNYCNLALYRLKEPGPYAEQLRQWVKSQNQSALIRFQSFNPWSFREQTYTLTPEETSALLVNAFEGLAANQDSQGIDTLIDAIATGHAKNKYALAGLLLRATQ